MRSQLGWGWEGVFEVNDNGSVSVGPITIPMPIAIALSPAVILQNQIAQATVAAAEAVTKAVQNINWDNVYNNLGVVARTVSNGFVQIDPTRVQLDFLAENQYTKHAFAELDKFTGGYVSTTRNVSTLVYRAARGDAITKRELVQDAVWILQTAAMISGGGAAVGGVVGSWTGNEVCKNQTDYQTACKAAFVIVGAASGAAISDALAQQALSAEAEEITHKTFLDYLSQSAQTTFRGRVVDLATLEAVRLCDRQSWVGDRECALLGKIAADYIKFGRNQDWAAFLGIEAAKLGIDLLMEQAFPIGSREREYLSRARKQPKQEIVVVPNDNSYQNNQTNPLAVLLLAGGFAFMVANA